MFLLLAAGLLTSIACATTIVTGFISPLGRVLSIVVTAIGITFGTTVGTVVGASGVSDMTTASIGILAGALSIIAGNATIRRWIKKAKVQRNY